MLQSPNRGHRDTRPCYFNIRRYCFLYTIIRLGTSPPPPLQESSRALPSLTCLRMYSILFLSPPLHICSKLTPATISKSEPSLDTCLSSCLIEFLLMPGCPPLTACSTSQHLKDFLAQPVRLVVIGSGGGWVGVLLGEGD